MPIENAKTPPGVSLDPDLSTGLQLLAHDRRQRLILQGKIILVWIAVVVILLVVLLQLRFEPAYIFENYQFVLQGALTTIGISLASISIATILALLGALGRISKNPIALGISGFYISFIRGTPLLVQIFLIYYGLPQLGIQLRTLGYPQLGDIFILSAVQAGIVALSLNYGAYMTEIFRAGIQSIPHGQHEAAEAIGMSSWQTLRRVILPQGIKVIIPDIGNQFIAMQKDSALVSVIGVWEILYRASRFARKDIKFMEMFLLAAALYWILTIISSWLESRLEKRMAKAYER
ncbi:MAG: amino acid ABC transporter permease [Anaerolineales bacterium]|nr:amino acid ABC transporter permease [Anaerolineales bacterium]